MIYEVVAIEEKQRRHETRLTFDLHSSFYSSSLSGRLAGRGQGVIHNRSLRSIAKWVFMEIIPTILA